MHQPSVHRSMQLVRPVPRNPEQQVRICQVSGTGRHSATVRPVCDKAMRDRWFIWYPQPSHRARHRHGSSSALTPGRAAWQWLPTADRMMETMGEATV